MVDQAQVKPTNGHTELPPRAVARNAAEFMHDVATLAELQGKLAMVDLSDGVSKLVWPVVLVAAGAAVALGSIPIGLMALALTLEHTTTLSPPVCFAIALGVGVVLAALLIVPSIGALKRGVRMFDRSLDEWRRNRQWAKETLKRLGQSATRSPLPAVSPSRWQ
jgi:Putative Actinobacterial Holin-X, holin superfamily III